MGLPYTYFKVQVYPIYLHGPFGFNTWVMGVWGASNIVVQVLEESP